MNEDLPIDHFQLEEYYGTKDIIEVELNHDSNDVGSTTRVF